ncbi:hypothetical protein FOL47_002014 [Perkinsus chesapeaki]|uniref:Uncharacterized protein n=1 Tax=Perkinsus chesapeaki TaxID=330153 RepID=A0A7J6MG73_PERCH|nr:hypothetical protein FOL47_002014 [Perkinsus chesapeaki]
MLKSFVVISLAIVGFGIKIDEVDEYGYDEDSMAQLFDSLKELETEVKKMNEERVASFPKGVQQAQVDDGGKFYYPPGCNSTTQIFNYSYCFHGQLNQSEQTTIDAVVDLFDVDDPGYNTAIGLKAVYDGKTQSELHVHAGGDAQIILYRKKLGGATIYLRAYDEDLSQSSGLGDTSKESFVAIPHFKIYAFKKQIADIDVQPGENSKSYVFAGKPYNLGFNVSVYVEKKVKLGIKIGAALDLSLTTVKNKITNWFLKGAARIVVKPPIGPNVNFPYDYLSTVDEYGYDEDSMAQLFDSLKELETEVKIMNEERVASFPKGVQQAQVDDGGKFYYPPGCNSTTQIFNYSYCFHGQLNQSEQTTIDAVVDLFDIDDPRDNTAIGLKAVYDGKTQSELHVHAGGDAQIISFGDKKKAAATIYLKAYDEELSQPSGLGDTTKESFVAIPHFKIYGYGYWLADVDVQPGEDAKSYVFAGKPYNLGFNVSVYVEKEAKLAFKIGAALDVSLTTVKNKITNWFLKGSARVVVKPPIGPNFNFPYDYISSFISIE